VTICATAGSTRRLLQNGQIVGRSTFSSNRDSHTSVSLGGDFGLVQDLRRGTGRLGVTPCHERNPSPSEQKDGEGRERRSRHDSGHGPEPAEDTDSRGKHEETNGTGHWRAHTNHTFGRLEYRTSREASAQRYFSEAGG
jgi:hypothetical protein